MDFEDIINAVDRFRISEDPERRHVESIHILVTTVIIASYFTPSFQEMVSGPAISLYTDGLLLVSIVYLTIRLVDVTIPLRELHRYLNLAFGFLAPLGFLLSVLGYLGLVAATQFDVSVTYSQAISVILVVIILSIGLAAIRLQHERMSSDVTEKIGEFIGTAIDFEVYIVSNPEEIEEGLDLERARPNEGVDFIGTDQHGNQVLVEAKLIKVRFQDAMNILGQFNWVTDAYEDARKLLIVNEEPTTTARELLEREGIEVIVLNIDFS